MSSGVLPNVKAAKQAWGCMRESKLYQFCHAPPIHTLSHNLQAASFGLTQGLLAGDELL